MGIKIVSQPIGSPIIAAADTAMAMANQRTAQRQSAMWMQQVEHKYKTKALEESRTFEAEEDAFKFGRDSSMRPIPKGVALNPSASKTYGALQAEERDIYGGLKVDPRSPEAQKRLEEIQRRKRAMEEWNPDPTPEEAFDKGRIFLDPSGSRVGPDGMPYKTMPEGGRELWLDPKTGKYGPPDEDPAVADKRKADEAAAKKIEDETAKKERERIAGEVKQWERNRGTQEKIYLKKRDKIENDASYTDEAKRQADLDKLDQKFTDEWGTMPDFGVAPEAIAAPVPVPEGAVTPTPISQPGSQGPGPASTQVPIAQPESQGPGAAVTPTLIATPAAQPSSGPPMPPTATPKQAGEPLPSNMEQVPAAYWPSDDRKTILEPDVENRVWKQVTDPKRIKELNIQVYKEAYDKLLPEGKTYEQLTPEEKVQVRRIKEGYAEVSTW